MTVFCQSEWAASRCSFLQVWFLRQISPRRNCKDRMKFPSSSSSSSASSASSFSPSTLASSSSLSDDVENDLKVSILVDQEGVGGRTYLSTHTVFHSHACQVEFKMPPPPAKKTKEPSPGKYRFTNSGLRFTPKRGWHLCEECVLSVREKKRDWYGVHSSTDQDLCNQ